VEAAANRAQFGVASADPVVEGAYQRLFGEPASFSINDFGGPTPGAPGSTP
jgi:hypothetical protein